MPEVRCLALPQLVVTVVTVPVVTGLLLLPSARRLSKWLEAGVIAPQVPMWVLRLTSKEGIAAGLQPLPMWPRVTVHSRGLELPLEGRCLSWLQ